MRIWTRGKKKIYWYDFGIGGVRYRGSTGETDRRKAAIAADAIKRAIADAPPAPACFTIGQVIATWYADKIDGGPSADSVWYQVETFDRCLDTKLPIATLNNALLMEFRARRRGEGCGPVGINRGLSYLRAAINHCHDLHGQPKPDIAWRALRYKEPEGRIRFAGFDEYGRLLEAAMAEDASCNDAAQTMTALITTAVGTGMRRGNLFALHWHHIDLRGGTITLQKTKGAKAIVVKIGGGVAAALQIVRSAATRGDMIPSGPVFDLTNYRRKWQRIRDAAGCPDLHWHDLRHTFATYAKKGGADLMALKEAMAHSSIQSTMRYAHISADDVASTFDRAANIIEQAAQKTAQTEKSKA
jgi:integrase